MTEPTHFPRPPIEGDAPKAIDNPHLDKRGADLDRQRFQILTDIAAELSSEVVFPTSFDVVVKLRKALQDPQISLPRIAAMIALEPFLATRVIALANSAMYNPGQMAVKDVKRAIERIGLNVVRSTAMAIAMRQLVQSRKVVGFQELSQRLWGHSLRSASAAYVLAKRLTRLNPDEALMAGLVHDLGAFYMIYRAGHYEELLLRPDTAKYLVLRWHEAVGHALAVALGMPDEIADAMQDHDQPRVVPDPPKTLADVVYLANLIAGGKFEWADFAEDGPSIRLDDVRELGEAFRDEIDRHQAEMVIAFAD